MSKSADELSSLKSFTPGAAIMCLMVGEVSNEVFVNNLLATSAARDLRSVISVFDARDFWDSYSHRMPPIDRVPLVLSYYDACTRLRRAIETGDITLYLGNFINRLLYASEVCLDGCRPIYPTEISQSFNWLDEDIMAGEEFKLINLIDGDHAQLGRDRILFSAKDIIGLLSVEQSKGVSRPKLKPGRPDIKGKAIILQERKRRMALADYRPMPILLDEAQLFIDWLDRNRDRFPGVKSLPTQKVVADWLRKQDNQ